MCIYIYTHSNIWLVEIHSPTYILIISPSIIATLGALTSAGRRRHLSHRCHEIQADGMGIGLHGDWDLGFAEDLMGSDD